MKFVDLKEDLETSSSFCYVLEGEDVFFLERAEEMIKKRFMQEPSLNYTSFDAVKGDKLIPLVDALYEFPFMSEKRLVKVVDFIPSEKDYDTYLKKVFDRPVETSVLLIVNANVTKKTGQVDWKKKPNVKIVDCSKSDEVTIGKWIYLTCKRAGVAIDLSVCNRILRYCVSDMARISKETEKIISYVGQGGRVTDEIVDELVYPDADYKLYEISNAVSAKDYNRFMKIVKDLMTKGYDEMALLSTLASYYKTLYEIKTTSGTDSQIANLLGMKEYAVKKNREQANRYSEEELYRYYSGIYEGVTGMKMGNYTMEGAFQKVLAQILF